MPRDSRSPSPRRRHDDSSRRRDSRERDEASRRSRSRNRDRRESRRSNSRGRVEGGNINFKGKELTARIEGPNDKHCYRAFCEVVKPNGVKVTAAGPWQGDRRSAERDHDSLHGAFDKGGAEELFKKKSELFRKRHGR
mmetsp:Transcript_32550/g.74372  ORF Transcript_32550/g.74372 Transcript_32550/m.74372 type:complete len:138 (+) Transcript_32550:75-488(+)